VTSITTPSGSNANGGSITSNALTLSFADVTNPGIVSTGTQTFAGDKIFNNNLTLDGSTLFTALTIANLVAGGGIGTQATTVDIGTTFNINQTTVNQTITIPSPTITTAGRIVYINNVGTAGFTMLGQRVEAGQSRQAMWNGSDWKWVGSIAAEDMIKIRKSTDQSIVNSIANNNDTQLTFNSGANETWIVQFNYTYTTNAVASNDIRVGLSAPAGATCTYGITDLASTGNINSGAIVCNTTTIFATTATASKGGTIAGTITTGATAGPVTFIWGQGTLDAINPTIVKAGSSLIAYRVRGADLAEIYYAKDASISEGDIVSLDGTGVSQVKKSIKAYDSKSIGVISTKPGLVIGEADGEGKPVIVGLAGRVPVKVSTKNGEIKTGDYITTSDIAGVGMRATDAGQVVGKALTGLSGENVQGEIIVFIQNTYFDGQYDDEEVVSDANATNPDSSVIQPVSTDKKTYLSDGSLADRFTHLVRKAVEKLSNVFINVTAWVKELKADRIETKELCVEDVCVTKTQFLQMIQSSGSQQNNSNGNTNSGGSTDTSSGGGGTSNPACTLPQVLDTTTNTCIESESLPVIENSEPVI
jgi:hypothetical protein